MKRKGYLYALLSGIGWGTSFIACKLAFAVFPPLTLLLLRYVTCLVVLLIVYRKYKRPSLRKEDLKWIIVIGAGGYFFTIAIQMFATDMIDASMVSLINTLAPVAVLLFSAVVLHEKTNARQNIGIAVSIGGAAVIIGGAGGNNGLFGVLLALFAMMLWALVTVLIRRTCQNYDAVWLTIYTTAIAVLCNIPAAGIEIAVKGLQTENLSWMTLAGVLWLGVICTAGANLWWNQALGILPAPVCSMFYAVMPLTTALLGIMVLGEKITVNFIIGAVLIIAGMMYTILGELNRNDSSARGGLLSAAVVKVLRREREKDEK